VSDLPALSPPENAEAEPFWAALVEDRLVLPVCDACGHRIWYPRTWCPVCEGDAVTWTEMSGRGTVYACTVIRRGMGPWAEAAPYVGAYVELAEGPRILTNVVTDEPDRVQIGTEVEAIYVPVTDRSEGSAMQKLLRFAVVSWSR
jgi:uncharacterized OB-fold protein